MLGNIGEVQEETGLLLLGSLGSLGLLGTTDLLGTVLAFLAELARSLLRLLGKANLWVMNANRIREMRMSE